MKPHSPILRFLDRLILGNFPLVNDPHAVSRLRRFNAYTFCGFILLVLFIVFRDLKTHDTALITKELASLVSFIVLMTWSRHTRHYKLVFMVALAALFYTMLSGYFMTTANAYLYWLVAVPILSFLLLGEVGGTVLSLLFIGSSFIIYFLSHNGTISLQHTTEYAILNATLGAAGATLLLFTYESINYSNEKRLAEKDKSLEDANARLHHELMSNRTMAEDLAESLKESQQVNKQLQDRKIAMMNLLEDAKELEEQLKKEKENIEHTVSDRTRELHDEQVRMKASIDSLDSGFLMTTKDGTVIQFNPALVRLFGLVSESELMPKQLTTDMLHDKMQGDFKLRKALKKCLENAKPFVSGEIAVGERILTIFGAPILSDGRLDALGAVILVNDVTEVKMLERTKDEFVSIASHELRTPLTAIRGNSTMLLDMYVEQLKDDDGKQMLRDIKDASVRLISVVNQFLTMSRLEQGRTDFELEPVNVPSVIDRVVSNLRSLAEEKKLKLIINVDAGLNEVLADEARLEEVCTNLVGNSIKYTDEGSVTIKAFNDDSFVHVQVIDTGRGIDKESQDRLFRKFQQAASNLLTRDNSSSTGLGLYITKLLVEQMGGKIEIEHSELGEGSTFGFTLPGASVYNMLKQPAESGGDVKQDKEQPE